jgi:hypothetical protein
MLIRYLHTCHLFLTQLKLPQYGIFLLDLGMIIIKFLFKSVKRPKYTFFRLMIKGVLNEKMA